MSEERAIVYDDEIIEMTRKKKPKSNINNFQAIGWITNMQHNNNSTDIFKQLRKVSKSAYNLFDDLKDTRNPENNVCRIDVSELSASQLKMYRTRIKELIKAGIIKKAVTMKKTNKIKKGSFMLNPNFIKNFEHQDFLLEYWEFLK